MAANDLKRIIQVTSKELSIDAINNAFRDICEMIYKQEGRSGPITSRDSMKILADANDEPLTMTSTDPLVLGTQIALSDTKTEILRGAEIQNGLYIPTYSNAQILSIEGPDSTYGSSIRLYADTGLTPGVAYLPTFVGVLASTETPTLEVVRAFKTGDQTVTSASTGTTLVDVTDMTFSIAAGETWLFDFYILWGSGTTPDIKFAVTCPASPTTFWYGITGGTYIGEDASVTSGVALPIAGSGATQATYSTIHGYIVNGSTAGSVTLQFAQNTSSATNTTVNGGTHLVAQRID